MMDIKKLLEEWHETKDLSLANDICEALWDELEEIEDEPGIELD